MKNGIQFLHIITRLQYASLEKVHALIILDLRYTRQNQESLISGKF